MFRLLALLVLTLPLALATGAAAAEETVKVEEVVVTASKMEEPREEATSDVDVITAEEIDEANVLLLPEVLKREASLNLTENGGKGKLAEVYLRGGAPRQTLVMIDGVKVNSTTTGGFDFSGLVVEDIERIEIVKGPQSTIYGSEAMSGVINIITKKGRGEPSATASFEAGSYGTYKPSLSVSGGDGVFDYRFTASYLESDGISAVSTGTEDDGYKNAYFSGKVGAMLSEAAELELSGNYYYDRSELDGFDFLLGAVDDLTYTIWGHHYSLAAKGKLYLAETWEQVLTLSTAYDLWRSRNQTVSYLNSDIETTRYTADWQHNFYPTDSYTLTLGVEYREDAGENTGNFEQTVDNLAFYLNNKLRLMDGVVVLNAGVRNDDHEAFGSETTYRVGGLLNIRDAGFRVRASLGTSFRAPSFNELYYPYYGNPALLPEEGTAWEVGVEKDVAGRATLYATYFDQEFDNLIEFDWSTFLAGNVAEAEVRGVEAGVSVKVTDTVDVSADYTWLDAEDKTTGGPLHRRPENKVVVAAGYTGGRLSLRAEYTFMDEVYDVTVGRELGSYSLVNVSGTFRASERLTFFARVENLFDEDYETAGDYSTPGISAYGGVRATF